MPHHVLIPDNVHPSALAVLDAAGDQITYTAPGQMKRDEMLAAVPQADALIIRSGHKIDREVFSVASNLRLVARAGVGVDNVDLEAATEKKVAVMNTPAGNTIATAEMTFGLMLALARHIPDAEISMREGRWDRKAYMGTELRGKTLGIIGLGRIGRALATRAVAFEMKVLGYDPYLQPELALNAGAPLVDLETLYAQSDFISLHALITDETRDMINASSIARMKQGVRIINAARGALINEHDLAAAIQNGQVAGAALDVYDQEPPQPNNPLIGLKGVVHTPHLAASTEEAQVAVAVEAAELIVAALLRGEYLNVVNPQVLG